MLREAIDRVAVTAGAGRGNDSIAPQGELGAIRGWIDRTGKPGYKPNPDRPTSRLSVPVKARA